jgi:hypothetical protein
MDLPFKKITYERGALLVGQLCNTVHKKIAQLEQLIDNKPATRNLIP